MEILSIENRLSNFKKKKKKEQIEAFFFFFVEVERIFLNENFKIKREVQVGFCLQQELAAIW